MKTPAIIRHPHAVEYRLPEILLRETEILHPWFQQFMGVESFSRRQQLLQERWQSITEPWLRPLAEHLGQYIPHSFFVHRERVWLCLRLPEKRRPEGYPADCFVGPPIDPEHLRRQFIEHGFPHNADAHLFLGHFGSLKTEFDGFGFQPPFEWQDLFNGTGGRAEESENYDEWAKALVLCVEGRPDVYLLHEDGRVGFWSHEMEKIATAHASFAEFIVSYTNSWFVQRSP